jgi:hypothetical protein
MDIFPESQSDRRTSRSSMNEGRGENSMLAINKFQKSSPRQVSKEAFPKAFPKKSIPIKKKKSQVSIL